MESKQIISVSNLSVDFSTDQGTVHSVRDVSFHVDRGEILGVVGESGSGKSVTMYSVMGLLAPNGTITSGQVVLDGENIMPTAFESKKAYEAKMKTLRSKKMAMIFQDPMTFLNPVLTIGKQLMEPILNHNKGMSRKAAYDRAVELMRQVGISSPEKRMRQYPFLFSGGMRQRIVIAIALANTPELIIADEPTTALDVTIQAQILHLIKERAEKTNASVILITHDLGVVASICDRVNIMYGGKIVETGTDQEIFYAPKHPYTAGLLGCIHNPEAADEKLNPIPGSPPDLLKPPAGCPFVDRCDKAMRICKEQMPDYTEYSETHKCACWLNVLEGGAKDGE